jgi:flagellar biogenesis protein FliO
LTEDLDDRPIKPAPQDSEDTFSLKLNEALAAINAANGVTPPTASESEEDAPKGVRGWFAALDKLPPIRLPIGPAIPWKVGLPLLLVVVAAWGIMSRQTIQADAPGVQLPVQPTYAVQQEAPLFAKPTVQPTTETSATAVATADTSAPIAAAAQPVTVAAAPPATGAPAAPTANPAAAAQPIGVAEPTALAGFDPVDIGIKLIAVVALAYGSLMLLKRFGYGGARPHGKGAETEVRVVTSISLAPNRSVHVLKVPGGKTLLIGATPTNVNLLTELVDDLLTDD